MSKVTAIYKRHSINESNKIEATFELERGYLNTLLKLPKERLLQLDINERSNQRSLRQNAAMWALINEIVIAEDGKKSKEANDELYKQLIKQASIRVEYTKVDTRAIPILERSYRVVEELNKETIKGVEYSSCNLYRGSSDFDTKEMTDFIELILDRGAKYGIDITYYADELRGK